MGVTRLGHVHAQGLTTITERVFGAPSRMGGALSTFGELVLRARR
jgi:hypothetical protein